jgi:hypothetical protein
MPWYSTFTGNPYESANGQKSLMTLTPSPGNIDTAKADQWQRLRGEQPSETPGLLVPARFQSWLQANNTPPRNGGIDKTRRLALVRRQLLFAVVLPQLKMLPNR